MTDLHTARWPLWVIALLPSVLILFDGALGTDPNMALWFMPVPVIAGLAGLLIAGLMSGTFRSGLGAFFTPRARAMGWVAVGLWGVALGLVLLRAVNPLFGLIKLAEVALFAALALTLAGWIGRGENRYAATLVLAFVGGIALAVVLAALARWLHWPAGYGPLDMPGFTHIRIYAFSLTLGFAAAVGIWPDSSRPVRVGLFLAMALFATALFWSGGRGGLVALAVGLPLVAGFVSHLRAPLIPAVLALGLGACLATLFPTGAAEFGIAGRLAEAAAGGSADALTSGRMGMWRTLLAAMGDAPLLGHGFGQAHWIFADAGHGVAHLHAHNIVLDIGLGLGWPGLLVALLLIGAAWALTVQRVRLSTAPAMAAGLAIVTVFLILGLVDGVYFYHQGLLPLTIGIAILLAEAIRR